MYLEHYQLKELPFQLTPDPGFLYPSKMHSRAKAYMDYAIWNRDGFVVITGEIGAGKTTIVQKFLSELDQSVVAAKIFQTQLNENEFLRAVLSEFGIKPSSDNKVDIMNTLNAFLLECYARNKQLVLIVDEAQNLTYNVLEEIRMLSGLETRKEKILHVILVGQPELREKLDTPEMAQLLQRVRLRFHLKALSETETRDYIVHRLRVAGAKNLSIFADNTYPVIYQYTGGIPRLINTLCDTAMTCAYADGLTRVTTSVLKTAIEELQWQPFSKRVKPPNLRRNIPSPPNQELMRLLHENRQLLVAMNDRLARLESLPATLNAISSKMNLLEEQVTRMAATLESVCSSGKAQYLKTTKP